MGVTLLGGSVVIKENFGHAKSHPPYRRINKLKMMTAMLNRFFGLPTGLFCIGCFTAELGAGEAEGLGVGLK